jgi:Uma2 family endonuclease
MSPSPEHERLKDLAALFVNAAAEAMDIDLEGLGSTTFRREDLKRGFEPDSFFYVQSVERVRGKTELDLRIDPPPDLLIEIDITSPSISRFPLFAQVGVPEVWRCDGERWMILALEGGEYIERKESAALPGLTAARIGHFVEEGRTMRRPEWLRWVRDSVRQRE